MFEFKVTIFQKHVYLHLYDDSYETHDVHDIAFSTNKHRQSIYNILVSEFISN